MTHLRRIFKMEHIKEIILRMLELGYPEKEYFDKITYIQSYIQVGDQSSRKGITYKTKQEKAYVTKEPLWWLPPEEGRKLNKGKILLVARLKRQSSFSQFLSLFR